MIIDSSSYSGLCSCGREHRMVTKAAVIEPGCLERFEAYLETYGIKGRRCCVYGGNSYRAVRGLRPRAEQELVLDPEGLHANEVSTAWVMERLSPDTELLIAVGSGTIHDIVRWCANERQIPFVSVPTGASVDGFCSTVAAMTWYGYKKTIPAVAPVLVLADTNILAAAPMELVRSGVGDILAKYVALAEWKIAHLLTGEHFCQRIYDTTLHAADTVMESIPGILRGEAEAYGKVCSALVMSGIAMQMMGSSRPASGAEHHISHLIEMQPEGLKVAFPTMHGEKTGVGAVVASGEYRRLIEREDITGLVQPFKPLDRGEIEAFFGPKLKDAIINENQKDCLQAVDPKVLAENWQQIRALVAEIPEPDRLYQALETLDAKRSLEDIGIDPGDRDKVLRYSAMVRDRLTLMRIRRMIKDI